VLTLKIVTSPTMQRILFGTVFNMIAWAMLDLLTVNAHSAMAVQASNLGISSQRDGRNAHLGPLVGFNSVTLE
jgi:hypothetical protein